MKWVWRGELFPLTRTEYENLKYQYDFELMNNKDMEIGELNEDEYKKIKRKIRSSLYERKFLLCRYST